MTNEQALKILLSKLECMKREQTGTDYYCIRNDCDNCYLCYAQGNMGEQKEALLIAINLINKKVRKSNGIRKKFNRNLKNKN